MEGGGRQKKIGGCLFWILQYPEWPQLWPQVGTAQDVPVHHGPKYPEGYQYHRRRLFAGFSGIFRHCLSSVQPQPQGCGNFLQIFNTLHSGVTSIARPKCCHITAGDRRTPLVCGGILPSTAQRIHPGSHRLRNWPATPGDRDPHIQGLQCLFTVPIFSQERQGNIGNGGD